MPYVSVERKMRGIGPGGVWEIARDLESYPRFMDQVVKVERIRFSDGTSGTSWTVLFNGNELRWDEIDDFYPQERRLKFRQVEGDLADWSGGFEVRDHPEGALAKYEITFDLGVPALAHVIHPLAERAIRSNCLQMLQEIEYRCSHGRSIGEII